MEQIIFHIDVNSAYLSWSALSLLEKGAETDLREIPSVIGGDIEKRHGIVLAKSVPAKKYGIVTGEPIVNAMRKCPGLTIEAPDHNLYQQRSHELMNYLSQICPDIEQVSVDECYMDYTPISHLYQTPTEAAHFIRQQVKERFGFTVNIGISDRKTLAKMASDFQKPDKVHTLYSYEIKEKLWPLPVSSLFMCGKSSVQTLNKLEIKTIGDLANADCDILSAHLKSHGITLWEYANGIDSSTVASLPAEVKGIGNSTTLSKDVTLREEACKTLLWLAESVGKRLREADQLAGMVSVEIKYSSFRSVSHQTTLDIPSDTTQFLYQTACSLFDDLWDGSPIRLLGLRTSKLCSSSEPFQMSLFDLPVMSASEDQSVNHREQTGPSLSRQKLAALDKSLDDIRRKYGENAIIRGSLLKENKPHKH
ncbi:MAG: DNA polymerase IV [Lachnospiraceae bacterium]|nr:DNA polymerase IV [Lachnospiraceae bacterium]